MTRARIAALVAVACAITAHADGEADAERALQAAEAHAAAGDPRAIDELETLGAARPATRWTDDAWAEAARLAERAGDYARARRDAEQAVATASDDRSARKARAELARLERAAGTSGQWDAVAAAHDRLVARLASAGGDPRATLAELERLVDGNPGYPRGSLAMIAIARGWERDGDSARAIGWLRRARDAATANDRVAAQVALVGALARDGDLDAARAELAHVEDPAVARELDAVVGKAARRRAIRWALAALLVALAAAAAVALRRGERSWRAAARRVARPPVEVWYLAPIAAVLVVIARTGNPLVAGAVTAIAAAGVAVAWSTGALLDSARARGRVTARRAGVYAALAACAVLAAAWLAIDRRGMIDLVEETWREGPAPR